ncbi:MAG: iron chelate uptake ABC transporter family permease subunit [Caldilineaceae bacterium]|nr:iron chelate uptake ABC transporter family permease subunit [Caldilineaceae bacterium]
MLGKHRFLFAPLLLLMLLAGASLFIGVSNITLRGLFTADDQAQIFLIRRVRRLIAILTAGMSMSVVGLIMQQLARNKFVTPSTAGTMEAASLGILVATLFFGSASVFQKMSIGFLFALAGTVIFMRILETIKYRDVIKVGQVYAT